jgi:hypothetical protein
MEKKCLARQKMMDASGWANGNICLLPLNKTWKAYFQEMEEDYEKA